jgi:NAD(P)-dependent dehydrogenase (short-subunit alcohol dehydrogenase family)
VQGEIRAGGGAITAFAPVDLSDPDAARTWVEDAVKVGGGIDVLYNNASAPRVGPFDELTWEDWRFTIQNELDLIFTVTKAAWPHLIARGGATIINTASVSAYRGAQFVQQAAHGAAKGGVLSITRHLAASGAPHGIRANSISPGMIATEGAQENLLRPDHPMHAIAAAVPLGRLGTAEDVVGLAAFLAGPEASYITGANFVVDGGWSAVLPGASVVGAGR